MTRSRRSAPTSRRPGSRIAAELTGPALAEGGDTLWLDDDDARRRARLPDERDRSRTDRGRAPGGRRAHGRPPAPPRSRRGAPPAVVDQPARRRSRARLPAAAAGAARAAAREAGRRHGRGAGRGVRVDGLQRARVWRRGSASLSTATRRRAGVWKRQAWRCALYAGEELSRKGDGGPTCLTRPLARG